MGVAWAMKSISIRIKEGRIQHVEKHMIRYVESRLPTYYTAMVQRGVDVSGIYPPFFSPR